MNFVITLATIQILIGRQLFRRTEWATLGEYGIVTLAGIGCAFATSYLQIALFSHVPGMSLEPRLPLLRTSLLLSGIVDQGLILLLTLLAIRFVFERDRSAATNCAALLALGSVLAEEFLILQGRTDLGRIFTTRLAVAPAILGMLPYTAGRDKWTTFLVWIFVGVAMESLSQVVCYTSATGEREILTVLFSAAVSLLIPSLEKAVRKAGTPNERVAQ